MAGVKPSEKNNFSDELLGLKPRMIRRAFELAGERAKTHDFRFSAYLVEVYNNNLQDVLWKQQNPKPKKGVRDTCLC